ncbi:DUF2141 domain-containing protein [Bernardetia sp. Wsw4-3y2]|uniref:DUF2141 domain-containing protein n=1 Tax=Bernardetia sp. Wsw4-3y2 TaxID=3127471 RepID=UPI0030CCF4F5
MKSSQFFKTALFAVLFMSIFAFSTTAFAQHTLTVEVSNIKSDKGTIMIALFKGEAGFPKDDSKAVKKMKVTIKDKKATITFTDLEAGDYAFALFHDENGNSEMDSNMFGIPKEGYGFSTNFKPKVSAPDFDEADFKIEADTVQKVKIIN